MEKYGAQDSFNITRELEPFVEKEMNRHLSISKPWYPHEYIPWDLGKNYARLGGEDFDPSQSLLSDVVQTSLLVSLLGEDNLPQYHTELTDTLDRDGIWRTWIDLWSAEENRHSIALRDYIVTCRVIDPKLLEDMRREHMKKKFTIPSYKNDTLHTIVYTTIQELGTRIMHKQTAKITNEPIAEAIMGKIAMDENLHFIVYRNLVQSAFEINPDLTMEAVSDVFRNSNYPQHEIPDYKTMTSKLAFAGIYDMQTHLEETLLPMVRYWDIENLKLSPFGERHRVTLFGYLDRLKKQSSKFNEIREQSNSIQQK
jgi:acyl-[acyl-carrier-protein] desaturase